MPTALSCSGKMLSITGYSKSGRLMPFSFLAVVNTVWCEAEYISLLLLSRVALGCHSHSSTSLGQAEARLHLEANIPLCLGFVLTPRKMLSKDHPHLETFKLAISEWSLPEYLWPVWFLYFLCICMCICFCVYAMCAGTPKRPEEGIRQLWATWCRCWEPHLDPLGEQQTLLPIAPSLYPLLAF